MRQEGSLQELKLSVAEFCTSRNWDQFHAMKDLAIGVSTEASELLELCRFKNEEQLARELSDPQFREHVSDELADVLFFLLRIAQRYDFSLSDALQTKLVKNAQRYPVDKSYGSNLKACKL